MKSKRTNVFISVFGQSMTKTEAFEKYGGGCSFNCFDYRLSKLESWKEATVEEKLLAPAGVFAKNKEDMLDIARNTIKDICYEKRLDPYQFMSDVRRVTLGFDSGLFGAIALINGKGKPLTFLKMPTLKIEKKSKRRTKKNPKGRGKGFKGVIDIDTLIEWLEQNIKPNYKVRAAIENLDPQPIFGALTNFALGANCAVLIGVCKTLRYDVVLMKPREWQKIIWPLRLRKGKRDKSESLDTATEYFPELKEIFAKKSNDGIAEAFLVAVAARKKYLKERKEKEIWNRP